MSTWYDNYWAALKTVIASAWPEVPNGQLFRDTAIERRDWTDTLNRGGIVGPWVVVKVEFTPTDEWVSDYPCYEVVTTIYRTDRLDSPSSGQTIETYITNRLLLLQSALYAASSLGTVLDDMPIQTTAENPITESLLTAKIGWQSGSLQCTAITGVL